MLDGNCKSQVSCGCKPSASDRIKSNRGGWKTHCARRLFRESTSSSGRPRISIPNGARDNKLRRKAYHAMLRRCSIDKSIRRAAQSLTIKNRTSHPARTYSTSSIRARRSVQEGKLRRPKQLETTSTRKVSQQSFAVQFRAGLRFINNESALCN